MTIEKSYNFTKRDIFNTGAARVMSLLADDEFKDGVVIRGAAVGCDVDSHGVEKNTSYIVTEDGTIYSGVSATARESVSSLIDMMEETPDGEYRIRGVMRKTKDGARDFLSLELV